jgi:hypothetical protein
LLTKNQPAKELAASQQQRNQQNEARIPVTIQGTDNRGSQLHPARFLPGAFVSVQWLWHEARWHWGPDCVDAIPAYDMEGLGHTGCITAHGWETLHDPGSADISIIYFSCVGRADSGNKTVNIISEKGK